MDGRGHGVHKFGTDHAGGEIAPWRILGVSEGNENIKNRILRAVDTIPAGRKRSRQRPTQAQINCPRVSCTGHQIMKRPTAAHFLEGWGIQMSEGTEEHEYQDEREISWIISLSARASALQEQYFHEEQHLTQHRAHKRLNVRFLLMKNLEKREWYKRAIKDDIGKGQQQVNSNKFDISRKRGRLLGICCCHLGHGAP
ncbi:hypothetical protein BDP27DRAFT_1365475 [Rhodocollybia butyracea]|uniref:Uncharacterized protein n=1 Tax=Rhodocollybia butyracea TaxID=206335 RepID=A0A9P5PMP3_9AGAR|nr:hypothetical protein BDP27DRAFT_1365475 [Rhodocollybia butyracea]